ncbi:GAF domain-containing SpoIIE family protein phosphatase [Melioribacteraceae bacterium 4301-Me]|uniref:GAF domain-containing SpoIIE family protein phosphatase n=1 Tax=Pyranulibacter aquaticus TaxID=3163344 RepID=UPI003595904E
MNNTDKSLALRNLTALVDFSNLINSSLDLNFILNNLLLTCLTKFQTSKALIAIADENGQLIVHAYKGIPKVEIDKFPKLYADTYYENNEFKNFAARNSFLIHRAFNSAAKTKGVILLGARLIKKDYSEDDIDFLDTLLNVGVTAIENSIIMRQLKQLNRALGAKVNQLSSLFDLSKEFSGILDIKKIGKVLVFSVIGQMLVAKYAVVTHYNGVLQLIENNFDETELKKVLQDVFIEEIKEPLNKDEIAEKFLSLRKLGAELIVPMKIKNITKGLILLGKRKNELGYTRSDVEFISSIGSLAIISIDNAMLFQETLEKERLEKDIEIARNIQKNLFPKTIPSFSNIKLSAYNSPARTVGGDYYDIIKLDEERLLVAIADVSGKGVPAALIMANLQAFLKSICKQEFFLPQATNVLNDLVSENTMMGNFITFFWAVFNNNTKELIYVNAGHNPPLLIRNGQITKLKKGGMILGFLPTSTPYLYEVVQMQTNDTLVLFTDGVTEAMNSQGQEFTDERLEELLKNVYVNNANEILESIKTELKKFTNNAEQSDDITCIVIKIQ